IGGGASVGDYGIVNQATFNNNACGEISMFAPLTNSSNFTNAGLFRVSTLGTHDNSALTNNGIITYPQGNPIPNVTNNDVVVQPVSGGCTDVNNALQLGGAVSFTAGTTWYLDESLTQSGGTYNPATNTFTPTNLPAGVPTTVYFSVTDNASGCARTVSINITAGSAEICDGVDNDCNGTIDDVAVNCSTAGTRTWTGAVSTDWHTPCNWNPACVPAATDDVVIPNVANDPVI
ncbi:MAG: putative metal-binding motif-containing protein, partial [Saprospiraceae bacterium]